MVRTPDQALASPSFTPGWATFGLPLAQGALPAGQSLQVGGLTTQAEIKTTWGDGSARFVAISCKPTGTGALDVVAASPTGGTFTPTVPTATVTLTVSGTDYVSALPGGVGSDLWLSGPNVQEWRRLVVPIDGGSTPHPLLRVYFDVRCYSDGSSRLEVIVENCLDVTGGTSVDYGVAIVADGSTVFTQSAVSHWYMARWRKVFLLAGLAESQVAHDLTPHFAAGTLLRYSPSVPDTTLTATGPNWAILGCGDLDPHMPDTGARPEVAPYPDWVATFSLYNHAGQRDYILANGDLAGSWPLHLRQAGGDLVSIDAQPYFWMDYRGPTTGPVGDRPKGDVSGASGGPLLPDMSHIFSIAYVPYLLTGTRYYAEEMKFWANYSLLATSPDVRNTTQGLLSVTDSSRAYAWTLRNIVDLCAYIPDADPHKSYFTPKMQASLDWADQYLAGTAYSPYWPPPGDELGTSFEFTAPSVQIGPVGKMAIVHWQQIYLTWSLDHAEAQGFSGGTALRDRMVAFQNKLLNSDPDYPHPFCGPYVFLVGTYDPASPATRTYYTTMAEAFAENALRQVIQPGLGFGTTLEGFYGPEIRMSQIIAIRLGLAGAWGGYNYVMSQIVNLQAGWNLLNPHTNTGETLPSVTVPWLGYSDSFTLHGAESAGVALEGHTSAETGVGWAKVAGTGMVVAASERVDQSGTTPWTMYTYNATQASADSPCFANVTFPGSIGGGSAGGIGLLYRMTSGGDGYAFTAIPTSGSMAYAITKVTAWSLAGSPLATTTGAIPAGYPLRIEAHSVGTTLRLSYSSDIGLQWTVLSVVDSTTTAAGKCGILGYLLDPALTPRFSSFTLGTTPDPAS